MTIATDLEHYMLALVNEERTSRGLDSLVMEQNLNTSADAHSAWMSLADSFSHTGIDSSSATERMLEAGVSLTGSWGTAENLAAMSIQNDDSYLDEVDQLHESLMNSTGHRANILNPDLDYIGIGISFGTLTYSGGNSYSSLLITQNFSYTDGLTDLDLRGDDGANTLIGENGNDMIIGDLGHDTIEGHSGNDTLNGENGFDVIWGGDGYDLISGGNLGDLLYGNNGNDTIDGGNGRDSVWMGNGNDVFNDNGQGGWLGGDKVLGGNGDDTINGGNGSDSFLGDNGNDVIFGGNGDDTIDGGIGGDRIFAGNNNDVVEGGFGRDTAFLGNGDDIFTDNGQTGWWGGDRVYGGNGSDTIEMSGGDDTVTGGAGEDVFIFTGATIENDIITDYEVGSDALHLDDALWGGGLSSEQVIAQFSSSKNDDTTFNFGDGNTLTLSGIETTDGLLDDLSII